MIEIRITTKPIAQPRQRHTARNGRVWNYLPAKHPIHQYKKAIEQAACKAYSGPVLDEPLAVYMAFVLPRPKNWSKKKTQRVWHAKKPDMDNLVKAVKDALTGIVWCDDARVCSLTAIKEYAGLDEDAHVDVKVWKA